jgi:hypothetical protein
VQVTAAAAADGVTPRTEGIRILKFRIRFVLFFFLTSPHLLPAASWGSGRDWLPALQCAPNGQNSDLVLGLLGLIVAGPC